MVTLPTTVSKLLVRVLRKLQSEVNPFKKSEVNPFKKSEVNPFTPERFVALSTAGSS